MDPRHIFQHVFDSETVIAAIVFGLVCIAVVVAILLSHRRRKRGAPPWRKAEHSTVEAIYGVGIAAVVGFVVYLSFHATAQERRVADPHAAQINITGFQWCWQFSYPASGRTVTGTCAGNKVPTMVVPVGQPVTLHITSTDVIHSWWVPELRYKLDAFPHHTNTVTITFDRAGRWIGRCAEFCGDRHAYMDFYLQAIPLAQYRHWLAGQSAGGANGTS